MGIMSANIKVLIPFGVTSHLKFASKCLKTNIYINLLFNVVTYI